MAFNKKTWLDRITEFPTRRTLTKSDQSTEVVDVARNEGDIMQEGDAFSATNMNDLEQRIYNAINELNQNLTYRWNPNTDNFEYFYDGSWHVDKKANILWDGYFYNKGDYESDKFTPTWNDNMFAIGATPSGTQGITGQNFVMTIYTYKATTDGSANGHEHIMPIPLPHGLGAGKLIVKYYSTGDSSIRRRVGFGIKSSNVASGENAMYTFAYGSQTWSNVVKQTGALDVGSESTTLKTAEIVLGAGDTENDVYFAVAYGGLGSYANSINIQIESIQFVANE